MSRFKYKGYHGSVEFSHRERTFQGSILDLKQNIVYKGKSLNILKEHFRRAVDTHLQSELS